MGQRKQFTFYRSFFEALKALDAESGYAAVMAICDYALDENEHELSGVPAAVFSLVKPNLDSSRKKAESGGAGGKMKQAASKPQANTKQTPSKREKKEEKEKEVKKDSLPPLPPTKEQKVQWADNVTMTNDEHDKLLATYGPADTAKLIAILDNYKGSSGKPYKSDYRAILSWCVDRLHEGKSKPDGKVAQIQGRRPSFTELAAKMRGEQS